MTFDDIDAKLGGSSIRGHLAIGTASPRKIDGLIEADAAQAPPFIAWLIGLPVQTTRTGAAWSWSSEPLGAGMFGEFTGQVALKLKHAELLPLLTASELKATLRLGRMKSGWPTRSGRSPAGSFPGK